MVRKPRSDYNRAHNNTVDYILINFSKVEISNKNELNFIVKFNDAKEKKIEFSRLSEQIRKPDSGSKKKL